MINPAKPFSLTDLREVLLRRIWYAVIPFVIISAGTILYILYGPREYRATALILVTPQKVPEQFVMPTVTGKIEERLYSITQEITSRTGLEQVISEFKLYPEKAGILSQEEIVELMRKNIEIEMPKKEKDKEKGKNAFTISYIGKDPKTVMMVTNKLTSLFIEENLRFREQQAQGTSEFLSVELNATAAKLEEQEKTIAQFKKQFSGELPEQRDANLRVFEQIQNLHQRVTESLRAAQDRKVVIEKQLADLELMMASVSLRSESNGNESGEESPKFGAQGQKPFVKDLREIQLEQFKSRLIDLQGKYTEKHPRVLALERKIASLEAMVEKTRLDKEVEENKARESKEINSSPPVQVSQSPASKKEARRESAESRIEKQESNRIALRYKEMESQQVATDLEIERLKEEEGKVRAQMARYRERIENTPIREQSFANLARDYQNLRESYQTLLKKNGDAEHAENLERRQKGEQFKVIDPAVVPEKPFRPNIPKVLLIGLFLAFAGGIGTTFVREQMDRSFRDANDLEEVLGLRVTVNVPRIKAQSVARGQ